LFKLQKQRYTTAFSAFPFLEEFFNPTRPAPPGRPFERGVSFCRPTQNPEGPFNGLLSYMPQVDEVYNRWEPHHFTDYDIAVKRDRNWNYLVYTNRIYIDTPGINNRILGLELYRKKVTGVHVWETFWWEGTGFLYSDNPWNDPGSHWGNGALSYFYPPRREGLPDEPDFSIVPSLRLETFRESADDYEYAMILEKLMGQAKTKGLDVSRAQAIMDQINRFFYNPVLWSQNDAWYLDLRDRMAAAIVDLKHKLDD
jgi:hypothetical protein